ncbi:Hypothetical protein PBC10988_28340 [Planctomycetales bacterium 10988]|nr:Hypothetical protein PBC10988_28340 [Planctomycetales bacterium 10988]
MRRYPQQADRQGMILIIVLGLLALFALVATAFLVTAESASSGSIAASKKEVWEDPYETILQRAITQVLAGTDNPVSVMGPHSLLEDMYGNQSIKGSLPNNGFSALDPTYCNDHGGMLYFRNLPTTLNTNPGPLQPISEYYTGCVITMLTGEAKGKSARITGYAVETSGTQAAIRLTPFEGMTFNGTDWDIAGAPKPGDVYLINGRPFNGLGFGYEFQSFDAGHIHDPSGTPINTQRRLLDAPSYLYNLTNRNDYDFPFALLPNPQDPDYQLYLENELAIAIDASNHTLGDFGATTNARYTPIMADEDYDAVDYQNMLLAMMVSNSNGQTADVAVPSLHRPDLYQYWMWKLKDDFGSLSSVGADAVADLASNEPLRKLHRRILMRPSAVDHPLFHRQFPFFEEALRTYRAAVSAESATPGPAPYSFDPAGTILSANGWDVDNDGDLKKDSIWVDLGFPVQSDASGRLYKPMAAILCLDLDSRLNLNAHGTLNDWANDTTSPLNAPQGQVGNFSFGSGRGAPLNQFNLAGVTSTGGANLPSGMMLSPAEIRLDGLLSVKEMLALMHGYQDVTLNNQVTFGRYGEGYRIYNGAALQAMPGITNYDDNFPIPGVSSTTTQSWLELPHGNRYGLNSYPSPFDWDGNGAVGLDPSGQPVFFFADYNNGSGTSHQEWKDDPAEMNLYETLYIRQGGNRPRAMDMPFTPEDLEPILRYADSDSSMLRSRILEILRSVNSEGTAQIPPVLLNEGLRNVITTESWDVPVPAFQPTVDLAPYIADWTDVGLGSPRHGELTIMDLLAARIISYDHMAGTHHGITHTSDENYVPGSVTQVYIDDVRQRVEALMSSGAIAHELLLGLKIDINRPFGNLEDDSTSGTPGFGVVDEPGENSATNITGIDESGTPIQSPADLNGDGLLNARDNLARQELAKQLFILALIVKDLAYTTQFSESVSNQVRYDMTVREIAQWAVNVVDFRDQDGIMTPFEYDADPFDANGWDVDGDITTNERVAPGNNPHRRVVWGMEKPVLLLTESHAAHDIRCRQENTAGGDAMSDDDTDQVRIPEGYAFFELYCVDDAYASSNRTGRDLRDNNGRVNLGKRAPGGAPVWRIAVSGKHDTSVAAERSLEERLQNNPDTTSMEPRPFPAANGDNVQPEGWSNSSLLYSSPPDTTTIETERYIFFTRNNVDVAGALQNTIPEWRVFRSTRNSSVADFLSPGEYAVIGPRGRSKSQTNRGAIFGTTTTNDLFEMYSGTRGLFEDTHTDYPDYNEGNNISGSPLPEIRAPLAIPCMQQSAIGASELPVTVGLNLTEPLFDPADLTKSWYLPANPTPDAATVNIPYNGDASGISVKDDLSADEDEPWDSPDRGGYDATAEKYGGIANEYDNIGEVNIGTTSDYKTAFLQRLANPIVGFHPVANPYITVDHITVDLTIFNSEADTSDLANDNKPFGSPDNNDIVFRSRERGYRSTGNNFNRLDLWSSWSEYNSNGGTDNRKRFNGQHTFGYINNPFQAGSSPEWNGENRGNSNSLPHGGTNTTVQALELGSPRNPFAWYTWNNRPYTSALELLNVPSTSPQRAFFKYQTSVSTGAPTRNDYYGEKVTEPLPASGTVPFPHLTNFFYSSRADSDPTTAPTGVTNRDNAVGNLFRVLDYVHVPTRFSGSEILLNQEHYQGGHGELTDPAVDGPFKVKFSAPFNRLSKYREPGKINLNTIFDATSGTWLSLTNLYPYKDASDSNAADNVWKEFLESRSGYPLNPPTGKLPIYMIGKDLPAEAASYTSAPFRSFGNGNFVPTLAQQNINFQENETDDGGLLIDGTILRREGNMTAPTPNDKPLFGEDFTASYRHSHRNPYFRHQGIERLANVTTTRSNVYAVWITIGYFEVRKRAPNDGIGYPPVDEFYNAYPDGYEIMQELDSDIGKNRRHRAFYLIDRSIPVGFRRGETANIEKTILLQRILE